MIKNSMLRVQKYLDRLATAKQYDKECIHSFGDKDGQTPLLIADLKALLQLASSAIDATNATAEADARDAARYRWLHEKSLVSGNRAWLASVTARRHDVDYLCRADALDDLDNAIDAAIAAQAKNGGAA